MVGLSLKSDNMKNKRNKRRFKKRKRSRKYSRKRGNGWGDYITPNNVSNAMQVGSLIYSLTKVFKSKKKTVKNQSITPSISTNAANFNPYQYSTSSFAVY